MVQGQYSLVLAVGVFCVALGLYEKLIDAILNFFKDIKKNFSFLFPIALGGAIGVFIVGNLLKFLFDNFLMLTSFAFIGLILGSINIILKQTDTVKINSVHILCFLLTFSFSVYLVAVEGSINNILTTYNNSYLILCGFLMSAGIVFPGVSKSVILMLLGTYELYLTAISTINLSVLFPLGIGLVLGGFIFLFVLNVLFKHFKSYTYFGIIGFVLGSVLVLYPGFTFNFEGFLSVLLLILCFFIGKNLGNKEKSH